jgi:succinate dehydrogenase/fumarate reductase flavoprotein subunit
LGTRIAQLRPPARELTFLGIMIKPGPELKHFLNVFRSLESTGVVARKLWRHFRDVLFHGRSMEISNGNALIAHLAKLALDSGARITTSVEVDDLLTADGRVVGVRFHAGGRAGVVRARRGVVLATGGFPRDDARRRMAYPHVAAGHEHRSPAPESNTGDGIRMAERLGARAPALSNAAAWAPVSLVPRKDREPGVFPHLIDRQKPGFIAVTRKGKRFVNEADSYHDFCRALAAACAGEAETCCFLVADHRTVKRYGMGFAKPAPVPIYPYVRSGYLLRGSSLGELARKAGIDPAAFTDTVETYNVGARSGRDTQFGRGDNAYNRYNGDSSHQPNPCVAPIEAGPFYAVRIVMGELGTFAGVATDERARVLGADDEPIPGLYAAGNDMSHIMAGSYLAGGTTLGPALTFGYIAGCDLADDNQKSPPWQVSRAI